MSVQDELDKQRLAAEAKSRGLQEWQLAAERVVNDRLVADIVSDFRRPLSQNASMIPQHQRDAEEPRAASTAETPVRQPPGIDIIDRMCIEQDRADRVAAIRREVETRWIESHFEEKPRVVSEYNPFDSKNMRK